MHENETELIKSERISQTLKKARKLHTQRQAQSSAETGAPSTQRTVNSVYTISFVTKFVVFIDIYLVLRAPNLFMLSALHSLAVQSKSKSENAFSNGM